MAKTDTAWEAWGRTDPYFGVVSHESFRSDRIDQTRDLFFAEGEDLIATRIDRYEALFGPLPRDRALDFGCGVGRLTLPLARRFGAAIGLDIAPSMLAEAERNATAAGVTNVTFAPSDDALGRADGTFDFVHSYIVLQHIPVRRGMRIVDGLAARVRPGGGVYLHFSVHTRGPAWRTAYWLVHHVPFGYAASSLLKGRRLSDPAMQMNGYSVTDVLAVLARHGMTETHLVAESHQGVLTYGVYATRSALPA